MSSLEGISQLADEELVRRVGHKDIEAFDELYRRYSQRVLRYLHRMLGPDSEQAQDCLQEVFLRLIEKNASVDTTRQFSIWIFAVAHNICCNERRRRDVRQHTVATNVDAVAMETTHGAGEEVDQKMFMESLFKELALLDEAKRSTFLLRFQENFTIPEISALLECPVGTIKSRLHYTCQLLAKNLKVFNLSEVEGAME